MEQHVDIELKLSLWIDATLSAKRISELVTTRLKTAFAAEAGPMLDPIRILNIREEAIIYATGADDLPTRFDAYEIHGMKRLNCCSGQEEEPAGTVIGDCEQVDDSQAEFWSLFGRIPGQGLDCVGDFASREHAEEMYARITGRRYAPGNLDRGEG
jgi:hypothetical protein